MFDTALDYCRFLTEDDMAALGGQLAVASAGRVVLDTAFGATLGRDMRTNDLHSGFCVTKPLLGLAIGLLVDRGLLEHDEVVKSSVVPAAVDGIPLADLLNHSAGLIQPSAVDWRLCPPTERVGLLTAARRSGPGYSEIATGLVLEELIEQRTGVSATSFVEDSMLGPLGIEESVIVSAARALDPSVRSRTSVPFAGLPDARIPLLSERLACQAAETRPAFGSLVTAGGLCRLYAGLERVMSGHVVDGLPTRASLELLLGRPARLDDPVLRRTSAFSGTFMVELQDHSFGYLVSRSAFGHSGGITQCAAFSDPSRELAVAFYLNGSVLDDTTRAEGIRSRLVDCVVEDLEHAA